MKSREADPADKEEKRKPFKSMKPIKGVELDEYEEAIGGDLNITPSQYN